VSHEPVSRRRRRADLARDELERDDRSVSYYSERSRRDPEWHARQLLEAREREQRARELDPEAFRARRREVDRRYRERSTQHGRTFHELWQRVVGTRDTLVTALNGELRKGTIDYCSTTRRFTLNGGLDDATKAALRELEL
jgi:hypothetical protein